MRKIGNPENFTPGCPKLRMENAVFNYMGEYIKIYCERAV
jgi:hypothetical protein